MDLEELRTVQTRERATDGLQELRESFYEDAAAYLESLREEREAAAAEAEDPFRSPRVNELTDEIETAEQVVEAIYERRIGKLVKQASLAAAGMPDDQDGLTTEEQDLYETLVARIEENKAEVLASLSGNSVSGGTQPESGGSGSSGRDFAPTEPAEADSSRERAGEDGTTAAAMMDQETGETATEEEPDNEEETIEEEANEEEANEEEANEEEANEEEANEEEANEEEANEEEGRADGGADADSTVPRTRVKVTEDVGEIFGVDERAYTLESDDVVDLPTENAKPLVDRDAAERLD